MDRFESLAKLTDRCSEKKSVYIHKIEIGRFAEVNKVTSTVYTCQHDRLICCHNIDCIYTDVHIKPYK